MNRVFIVILLACAAGCSGMRPAVAVPSDAAVILVRNPSLNPLLTTVCGPVACSEARLMPAGSESRFIVQAGSGTRAVVTAKRGDRVVAQHPVDFAPGDQIRVEIGVSPSHSPPRSGGSR
jgi:hypothetical protein